MSATPSAMPAPERRPEGTPALLDDSLGLAEQHVGPVVSPRHGASGAGPGRLQRLPEGAPVLFDGGFGFPNQQIRLIAQLLAPRHQPRRHFAQRLRLLPHIVRQDPATVDMQPHVLRQIAPAPRAQVRTATEKVGDELV
jgi:hypothetical protein